MIPIYKQEELDGLTNILSNSTIAYLCPYIKNNISQELNIDSLKQKAIALNNNGKFGLYPIDSVLASLGWNGNDDVFTKLSTWQAKDTAIDKPVNFMHNQTDIIGHMTASFVLDKDNKIIPKDTKEEDIPDEFNIVVGSVLYTEWSDEKLQARMNTLVDEIEKGKWFVSMECIFNDFDYAIITPNGEHKTIARNNETSFLTKHLRICGGLGEYQGYKIGRQLKNFVFIGKGIVDNPANKKSIILNTNSFISKANLSNFPEIKVNKMDEKTLLEIQGRFDSLSKSITELKDAGVAKVSDETQTTIANLKSELEAAKAKVTSLEASLTEKDNLINSSKAELVTVQRLAKATVKGLSQEEAEKLVKTWNTASEEQFDGVLALIKTEMKTTASDVLETTQTKQEPTLVVPSTDVSSETIAKASAWFSANITKKDKK